MRTNIALRPHSAHEAPRHTTTTLRRTRVFWVLVLVLSGHCHRHDPLTASRLVTPAFPRAHWTNPRIIIPIEAAAPGESWVQDRPSYPPYSPNQLSQSEATYSTRFIERQVWSALCPTHAATFQPRDRRHLQCQCVLLNGTPSPLFTPLSQDVTRKARKVFPTAPKSWHGCIFHLQGQ